jgi:hypothetical protein
MISISPHAGQPMLEMFVPSIHRAGQMPLPTGSLALISILPNVNDFLFCVVIRPEE